MDTKQNMEYKMVSEFISKTGASPNDALTCLKTWGWDLKRALTDYNDTYTVDFMDEEDETSSTKESTMINSSCHKENKPSPVLLKQNSIDLTDCKKLFRGISRATDNVSIVSRARSEIAMDFYKSLRKNVENAAIMCHSIDTPDSTFILPNIYNYPEDFRVFIEKDLIEMSTLNALEQTQRLNWWVDTNACRKLWPLATTGDGNCLLHAASLGMWGFHDRKLTLRTALYSVLSDGKFKDALRRRWRFQQTQLNKRAGFVYSESEWAKEWDDIIVMASPEPRNSIKQQQHTLSTSISTPPLSSSSSDEYKRKALLERNTLSDTDLSPLSSSSAAAVAATAAASSTSTAAAVYESLEEIHILALAHVLRRTIIVISDTVLRDLHGEAMAPITFGGIYLPFEIEPKECNRGPLLLAYDMAHFSALVPMENGSDYPPSLVPLIDYENILLPIQFCIDPGENFDWKSYNGNEENWILTEREHIALLKEYLDIVYVTTNSSPDDEICCEDLDDDFEKKFTESEIIIPTTGDFLTTINTEEANNNTNNMSTNTNNYTNNNNNSNGNSNNNNINNNNNKSKASRQLHSVAKQFGSIGKNMSRKLKKNIGSIAKLGGGGGGSGKSLQKKNSFTMGSSGGSGSGGGGGGGNSSSSLSSQSPYTCSRILCARLRLRRHEYQEEMIRNYIECAQNRFIEAEKLKAEKATAPPIMLPISTVSTTGTTFSMTNNDNNDDDVDSSNCKLEMLNLIENENLMANNRSLCINAGCNQFATSDTHYLCPECFEKQKKHENLQFFNSSPRYGTGNSKFYTQADIHSHDNIRKLPSLRKLNDLDQTLYLSNSTFYNDVLPSYDELEHSNKESHRYPISASHHTSSSSPLYISALNNKQSDGGENYHASSSSALTVIPAATATTDNGFDSSECHRHLIAAGGVSSLSSSSPSSTFSVTTIIPITRPCKTLGCPFYGNSSTNFLCSKCQKTKNNQQQDFDYNHHHHNHHNNNRNHSSSQSSSSFQSNPLYAAPPPPPPTAVALYKSESKITSDI